MKHEFNQQKIVYRVKRWIMYFYPINWFRNQQQKTNSIKTLKASGFRFEKTTYDQWKPEDRNLI